MIVYSSFRKFSSLTREQKAISVKDRIKEFEAPPSHEAVRRDDSKPKRKKPKSKAFEDFETSGILIGFVSSDNTSFDIHVSFLVNARKEILNCPYE